LMSVSYGLALLAGTYGFVAVFTAGLAFRVVFDRGRSARPEGGGEEPGKGENEDGNNLQEMIRFHDQVERFGELVGVLLAGALAGTIAWRLDAIFFAVFLFLVARPLATLIGLWRSGVSRTQGTLIAWLGIRGVGSLYYLAYAAAHGLGKEASGRLLEVVIPVITLSIFVHGLSSSYLMEWYRKRVAPAEKPRVDEPRPRRGSRP
jgi:sodium/hydrogen antiporter